MNDPSYNVVGLLGSSLDSGVGKRRWERWRPTVALCQQPDLKVDRFELLYQREHESLLSQVVDDVASISPETVVVPTEIQLSDPWDFEEVYGTLHDFVRSHTFDADSEDWLVHISTGSHVQQICLFLLTESRHIPAQLLQTGPPPSRGPDKHDPCGVYRIIDLDLSQYDRLASRFESEHQEGHSFLKAGIETRNRRFNELVERIEHVALNSNAPLLLTGPTGAGKSQLARRIFELKKQRGRIAGEMVDVNCAVLRGDQAMSTLFGHVKGAFTGAMTSRPGLLKSAHHGLLFLDEIGELGLDEQAMLLRAIEEKRFLPVGSDREISSDFRLIAGTNRDLRQRVLEGQFREDLLARINLWTFELPGLAQRREDIEPNVTFELDRFAAEHSRRVTFNREAREAFLRFAVSSDAAWSANFRDLNAAITRMATLAPSGRITRETVDEEITRLTSAWQPAGPDDSAGVVASVVGEERAAALDRFDIVQFAEVIHVCRQSRSLSDTGRILFSVSRQAKQKPNDADRLRKYLARFGTTWAEIVSES